MKDFCIVIPLYKEKPDYCDLMSLGRTFEVIKDSGYDVFFLIPDSGSAENGKFDRSGYSKFSGLARYIEEDSGYFNNNITYSFLLTSYDFYKRFEEYEYMYILQTDCWVMRDEFKDWTKHGYEWIGAPIISELSRWFNISKYGPQVGNGGFSLRKVSSMLYLTDPEGEFLKAYPKLKEMKKPVEDKYFCNDIASVYYLDRPGWKHAARFAIDFSMKYLEYYKIDVMSTFGIHAVWKNLWYWKDKIPELNDKRAWNICYKKYKKAFDSLIKSSKEYH